MKIGVVSDSLGHLPFEEMLDSAASLGIEGVEINAANWTAAPHLDLPGVLASAEKQRQFTRAFAARGLDLIALNANGNQLHPTEGERQSAALHDTIRLAGALGVDTVVLMSGLPAGGPDDRTPNWIISSWPPETQTILKWQWEEKLLPYWRKLASFAETQGVKKLCVEIHGNQLVYNVPALLRLRQEIGPIVGANLDPSHLMWMGADPLAAVDALGEAILHCHAKDTYLNKPRQAVTSLLENGSLTDIAARSWSYITLGFGHPEGWWRDFCYRLRLAGYDGWLSIEHEDVILSRIEGLRRSVDLLRSAAPIEASDFKLQAF
ncbi:sugar phosphate isomerase/epimerase [Acidisoma cellulosilytica]|uniref:Sugar phosphate isomerase/epimerase n=1 Tax=Acidisoma cellulosilyticum TaxID=2802395 RepID=A0A963Z427_9PROT|nr:sugar phosphate isomerase/epimerase [Acidisoma cellulosilyticum]MCB8882439.1 sugar phosphate isomerase/epimerase [Acidisoma cellulosilyticum]